MLNDFNKNATNWHQMDQIKRKMSAAPKFKTLVLNGLMSMLNIVVLGCGGGGRGAKNIFLHGVPAGLLFHMPQ